MVEAAAGDGRRRGDHDRNPPRPPGALRSRRGGHRRRLRRPPEVGALARRARAPRRGPARRAPRQPPRRRGPRPAGPPLAARAPRPDRARGPLRAGGRARALGRRRDRRRGAGDRGHHGGEQDGDAGGARDLAIAARVRAAGVRCSGRTASGSSTRPPSSSSSPTTSRAARIGLISQSGNLALEIGSRMAAIGLGFSRFASLGNQVDVQAAELVRALAGTSDAADRPLRGGPRRRPRARRGRRGGARGGQAGAAAGGGALRGDGPGRALAHRRAGERRRSRSTPPARRRDPARALAARAGRHRRGLLRPGAPRGRRVACWPTAAATAAWPPASRTPPGWRSRRSARELVAALRAGLPADRRGRQPDRPGRRRRAGRPHASAARRRALLDSGEVDAVLLTGYFGGYGDYAETLGRGELAAAEAMADAARASGRPLVVHSMYPGAAPRSRAAPRRRPRPRRRSSAPSACSARLARAASSRPAACPRCRRPARARRRRGYAGARALLDAARRPLRRRGNGRATPRRPCAPPPRSATRWRSRRSACCTSPTRAASCSGSRDEAALRAARRRPARAPGGRRRSRSSAWPPLADGVELIIGARWDARFGPLVMVGLGGIHAETLRDVARGARARRRGRRRGACCAVAPRRAAAPRRPRAPAARRRRRGARAVAALSRVAAAHPEIAEIEVNPLLALPAGALGLDARIVLAEGGG